ncbi:MAG: hypothetical protein IJT14_00855 [Rickettsiales bacterium]|nr:hypothetical protein [Rickettsiales bacterium]
MNPFEDADINYLKNLYYRYFPDTYNALVRIPNKIMTTEQVATLCREVANLVCSSYAFIPPEKLSDARKLRDIIVKIEDEMTYLVKNLHFSERVPRRSRTYSWPQYDYRTVATSKRFTFPLALKQKPTNMCETERNKLLSEYENSLLYNGVHPLDAFVAQTEMNKLLSQPYRDYDIYGAQKRHPLDAIRINNINNKSITPCYQQRKYLYV